MKPYNSTTIRLLTTILVIGTFFMPTVVNAQRVSDVLDVNPDQVIQGRDKFLVRFNGKNLEYDFWNDEKTRFIPLKDSVLFLSKQGTVVVYIKPDRKSVV